MIRGGTISESPFFLSSLNRDTGLTEHAWVDSEESMVRLIRGMDEESRS
jgi:hypothetical protein